MNTLYILILLLATLMATALPVVWAGLTFLPSPRDGTANRKSRSYTPARELPWPQRLCFHFVLFVIRHMPRRRGGLFLANYNSAEHLSGKISYLADNPFVVSAVGTRFLIAKIGTDDAHIDLCGAADEPLGVCTDAPVAGETASVDVFGSAPGTKRCIATAAIATGADIYTAAGGLVQAEPIVAGTYWMIGRALHAASGSGDDLEFTSCKPIKVVVLAALASVPNATAAAVDLATAEALANALKTNYNALQADVAALATAMATPALIKHL